MILKKFLSKTVDGQVTYKNNLYINNNNNEKNTDYFKMLLEV